MNKNDYKNSIEVRDFILWIEERLDRFSHSYILKSTKETWECNSIYHAYESFVWHKKNFEQTIDILSSFSERLRESIACEDSKLCSDVCIEIFGWGGVLHANRKKLQELGDFLCPYLHEVKVHLSQDLSLEDYFYNELYMSAGFTKIYSLLLDDFIIYDSRVGAALGLLVRKYCEEKELVSVPENLTFAWGNKRGDHLKTRNPSSIRYKFPTLSTPKRHLENNIRANWLLTEILQGTNSSFGTLEKTKQLRALECALFMVGYHVKR